ncbi:MAG: ATP-binding protein, partial [Alphaproteobacteria bacterium]
AIAKFYEAPLHVKAQGGVFVIDDFGRQIVKPEELLNRWIVPLERRVDFLKLHTGKQFEIPFDQLVIFSTNLTPNDLMDGAFLRRIPYKLEVDGPSEAEFTEILSRICAAKKIPATADDVADVVAALKSVEGKPLACYQAKFVVDQIVSACRFLGTQPQFSHDLVADAVANMYAKSSQSA